MMQIRIVQSKDAKTVYQFICELENTFFNYPTFEKLFLKNIVHPDYFYLIAEIDAIPIGYISCHAQILLHHCGLFGEIQELFVTASYRNKNVGQRLVEALENIAQSNNWVNLEVTCNKKRLNTHRFYKRLDFMNTHLKFVKPIK